MDASGYACLTSDPRRPPRHLFSTQYTFAVLPAGKPGSNGLNLDRLPSNLFYNVPHETLRDVAVKTLKSQHPIWFSCDVHKYFDSDVQLLNARASNISALVGDDDWELPKEVLMQTGSLQNSHAMTLVGYDEGSGRWKVENSWGQQDNDLVMTDAWFDRFVVCIVVPRAHLPRALERDYSKQVAAVQRHQVREDFDLAPVWDIYSSPQARPLLSRF
jgi:hypothetical protein